MLRVRNIQPRSFKDAAGLPGTRDNPFDRILHFDKWASRIPFVAYLAVFALLAWLVSGFLVGRALLLMGFFIIDYVLLFCLPVFEISFGPITPVWSMLAALRLIFWLIPAPVNLWFEIAGVALIVYGFYIEPQWLKISRLDLHSPKIPSGVKLKILQLGDLHMERPTRREKKILAAIVREHPDLILFSGDFLNLSYLHDEKAQKELRAFLKSLHARLGVYGVTGSPAVDLPELFPALVRNTGLSLMKDQEIQIDAGTVKIALTGLDCSHNPDIDFARLQGFHRPSDLFSILLYHAPDLAPLSCDAGFDLQLSGHTHGGQIRIPGIGALYAASLYGHAFEAGLYQVRQMLLYVTHGIGLEGASAPRVRLFCRPEITFFTLQE